MILAPACAPDQLQQNAPVRRSNPPEGSNVADQERAAWPHLRKSRAAPQLFPLAGSGGQHKSELAGQASLPFQILPAMTTVTNCTNTISATQAFHWPKRHSIPGNTPAKLPPM